MARSNNDGERVIKQVFLDDVGGRGVAMCADQKIRSPSLQLAKQRVVRSI
jgi:hypothetical protein